MGTAAVKALAQQGCRVIMACRDLARGEAARSRILAELGEGCEASLEVRLLDLTSSQSVRDFVSSLSDQQIDGLFNNAGAMCRSFALTGEGMERTMATNYLGPYLLTRLLLPQMAEGAHIVNMVSLTCKTASLERDCLEPREGDFSQLGTYGQTKLALMLFSVALAQRLAVSDDPRLRSLRVNMADPGIVNSRMISLDRWFDPLADVLFRPLCKSPEKGAAPAVRALSTDCSGRLFVGSRCLPAPKKALQHPLLGWLWDETASMFSLSRNV